MGFPDLLDKAGKGFTQVVTVSLPSGGKKSKEWRE
jgi:hypothetical protein